MNQFDDFWKDWKKERYKLNPKSRTTARVIFLILLFVLAIAIARAVILLT